MSSAQIEQQTKEKNRKKLIQQNLRLHAQLSKLQKEIQALDEHFNKQAEQQPQYVQLKYQIQMQERQIREIKQSVEAGRQSNAKQNMYYIKKQEDQLLWMKQELQNLLKEKDLVGQGHQDKLRKLEANEPLQKHKEELQKTWADTKRENRQISLKLVEMERQVRRLHALKERSKDKGKEGENQDVQLATLQSEIARMNAEMKMKELKWRPNGDVLDNQFFSHKNTLQTLGKKLEELQKQEGVWRLRSAALRDHTEIMNDRQRLSKITSIPKPEPIVKPVAPKQPVRQPVLEMMIQKQVRDNIKNDKFVDLVRVSSTPIASNLKKINAPPIQSELSRKNSLNQPKLSKESSKKDSKGIQQQKIPINVRKNEMSYKQKSPKQKTENKGKADKIDEPLEVNKNGNNWLGRRQRLKLKQSNNGGLAQMIRQKAEEVKKINQKLQEDGERERSVSSPKKKRNKDLLNRIQTQSQQNKSNIKSGKQKIDVSGQLNKMMEPKRKSNNSPQQGSLNQSHLIETAQDNKMNLPKSRSNRKRQKQQQLIEKIDISSKVNNFPPQKEHKQKKQKNLNQVESGKINEKNKQKAGKPQQHVQRVIQSPKAKQKRPVFQIFISDNPVGKISERRQQKVVESDEEDTDGIPKVIVRKKGAINQVTTGTST